MNLYEHTIIARQDVSPTQLKQIQEKYSNIVEKLKGNIVKLESWGLINLSYLIKKNKIDKKIKAVVACGNGTAGVFAPDVLKGIGCEVIELDCKLDFNFPKYNPNPEDLKMLHAISKSVKENNADIGFGFDGDGDRVGVIDDKGNEIFSDKIGLLIARNLSGKYKKSKFIVKEVILNLFVYDRSPLILRANCISFGIIDVLCACIAHIFAS